MLKIILAALLLSNAKSQKDLDNPWDNPWSQFELSSTFQSSSCTSKESGLCDCTTAMKLYGSDIIVQGEVDLTNIKEPGIHIGKCEDIPMGIGIKPGDEIKSDVERRLYDIMGNTKWKPSTKDDLYEHIIELKHTTQPSYCGPAPGKPGYCKCRTEIHAPGRMDIRDSEGILMEIQRNLIDKKKFGIDNCKDTPSHLRAKPHYVAWSLSRENLNNIAAHFYYYALAYTPSWLGSRP